jgi:ABC-2 type transport system permease protein
MKSIDVTVKGVKETTRDRRGFLFILGFPILLIVLFAFAFGSGSFLTGGSLPHNVVVVNEDVGVKVATNNTTKNINYGNNFIQVLTNATSENSSTHLFTLNNASAAKADDMLKSRNIDAIITIPKNFSAAFVTMVNNSTRIAIESSVGQQQLASASNLTPVFDPVTGTFVTPSPTAASSVLIPANVTLPAAGNTTSSLIIQGDAGYMNYATTQGLVMAILGQYKDNVRSNATALAAPGTGNGLFTDYIPLETVPIAGTQSFTLFDYLIPGLIVFALLMQTGLIAGSLAREVESGALNRLKLSKVRAVDLLFGTFVTWTLVALAQVIILIAIAIALGYHYQGGVSGLSFALIIGVIAAMASISLALLVAAFTKNEMQAISLGIMIASPLAFLAGAFMPLPRQELGTLGDHIYQVYDVVPWTHAVSSLRAVLTYGTGLTPNVLFEMSWLIGLTAVLFIVGVVTYRQVRLTPEK